MRVLILILLICYSCQCIAQCQVTICQTCGERELTVFYKDGSQGAKGLRGRDSCMTYSIPVVEPFDLAILVGEDNQHLKNLWVDPRCNAPRKAILDNCSGALIRQDTIALDIDDASEQQITDDYIAGKISSRDSFFIHQRRNEERYIKTNPDSFLAVYYLRSLIHNLDINTAIKYRDMVKRNNSRYTAMKSIDTYIANYKYKAVPMIGDTMLEFNAKGIDGKVFDSKTISDKVIILFFWYSGCGPCHRVMPDLRDMYERYKSHGLDIISFSLDTRENEWIKASADYQIPGINVSDLVGFSSQQFLHYGVTAFPFFVVFDRDKKINLLTFGDSEVPLIEDRVKELLGVK